jgi:serine/threonine-protein kinase
MASVPAESNLLFGLLALQNGLIDQGQLILAFQAWTRDKARSLADHLEARGDLSAAKRSLLEAIAQVHLEAHGGDVERSLAAVAAGRSMRESLAGLGDPDIDGTLDRVGSGGGATEHDDPVDPDRTTDDSVGSATSNGQRFRILRFHARGGLGAVSVAFDGELRREVALKQILEEHADDPASRRRFIGEAEITGSLEHPGIVPVYGLGTDGRGRPYYAMRLIGGESLKAAISRFHADLALKSDPGRRSLELRRLLRRYIDVCNAVEYAHSRGVIHRDLKPANIILGRHGETLVVDWGLAKSVGRADPSTGERTIVPSSSGSSETLPGSALGTPGFMSPEQARGELDQLGPRSDVYGLGATLYCLLTGRPPFEGEDAGAVLAAVQEDDLARPTRLDPSIDPALEAVCLKAMAREPKVRYGSARSLAEDVERWMADEPVTAWREPILRRAARWARRHRTRVTAGAAALVAGLVGLSAVLVVQTRANAAMVAANEELSRSKAAVQARYDIALEAIKTFHTGVSEDFLLTEAKFKELRDRLLKSASDFYGKLGALLDRETDLASRQALAKSSFELAVLTDKVGRKEDALAAHRAVLEMREALAAQPGADIGGKIDVGRSLTEVASLLYSTGKADEALVAYHRSESLLAVLAGTGPAARAALAACRTRMADLLLHCGRPADSLAALTLARADQEALAAVPLVSNNLRSELAATLDLIGRALWRMGESEHAEAELLTAISIWQKLSDDNPAVVGFRTSLARSRRLLASVLWLRDNEESEYRKAMAVFQRLVNDYPAVTQFRRDLGESHMSLGVRLLDKGRPAEGEAEFRASIEIFEKLADDNSAVTEFRSLVGRSLQKRARALLQLGRSREAEATCRLALAILQKLSDDDPAVTSYRDNLAYTLNELGDVLRLLGRSAEAKGSYEHALALKKPGVQEERTDTVHRYRLAWSFRGRGLTLRDLGDPASAAVNIHRALGLCVGMLPSKDLAVLLEKSCCHAALAGLVGRAGSGVSAAEGEIEAARAMECLGRMVAMGYQNANAIRIESAFEPLHSRDDFRFLMMDLAFPTEPFARAE